MNNVKVGCAMCDADTAWPDAQWQQVVKNTETTWRCPEHKNDNKTNTRDAQPHAVLPVVRLRKEEQCG